MKSEDVYNYRKDYRSNDRFENDIKKFSVMEEKYLFQFIEIHNKRRHKRSLTVEPWGNLNNKIIKDSEKLKKYCRPDYILNTCYDNSYIIKDKQPIEVQTCSLLNPDFCYIKKSKIDWNFDEITDEVCNKKTIILFVLGTKYIGDEKYSLLRPEYLKKIIKNGIFYPNIFGGKESYRFIKTDLKWRLFNHITTQQNLKMEEK